MPGDITVIGVDADIIRSELSTCLLTSVLPDAESVAGAAITQILQRIEEGGNAQQSSTTIRIPPKGLHYGESAPFYHSADPLVAKALRWMESHLTEEIGIDDVALAAGLSRRSLEYQFQQSLDCSPYQKLLSMRLERAKDLMLNTNKTIQSVALECGFSNQREFCVRFKQKMGLTPSAFRSAS
ncbi:MAG: helix-turn-helix domain-containing protein [Verrucomicrobia bacterium]|nr:helix-turn-helix domain-containing protein [Verrucomicrobiota bacterium]